MKKYDEFLDKVKATLAERHIEYGDSRDVLGRIGESWGRHLDTEISERDVSIMMIELKLQRLRSNGGGDEDSLVDIVGYAALAWDAMKKAEE